jgi:hypothetical protein
MTPKHVTDQCTPRNCNFKYFSLFGLAGRVETAVSAAAAAGRAVFPVLVVAPVEMRLESISIGKLMQHQGQSGISV